jgi:hypothetical protein
MIIKKICFSSKNRECLHNFLVDVLEWDFLHEKKGSFYYDFNDLQFLLSEGAGSGPEKFELLIEKDTFKEVKNRLELFLYSNKGYDQKFKITEVDLSLRKEKRIEVLDSDQREWILTKLDK